MKLTSWRIVKSRYIANAFSGEGARRFGGRWNSKGVPLVYTAGSQALAVLEILVHLEGSELLKHYRLTPITFDEELVQVLEVKDLPANWRRRPPPSSVRALGDQWVESMTSPVLRVPSAIVPGECNFLVNVLHRDFPKLAIGDRVPFRFDRRLQ